MSLYTSSKMAADDDGEVFEITDFTTASDWERFISRVEEILHEWKLVSCVPKYPAPKGSYTNGTWKEKTEELNFADFTFCLTHIWLKSEDDKSEKASEKETTEDETEEEDEIEQTPTVFCDLMNMENDFPSRAHCICRWYGVQDFVILSPAQTSAAIMTESRTKLLLSSVNIALSDAGCPVPVFVQVQHKWRRLYHGTSVLPGSGVEFGMVHLKRTPSQFNHLAGLLDVFKAKLGSVSDPRPPVSVAVRFLYVLYDWVNSPWTQPLPDIEDEVGCSGFEQLPFGACEDPISSLNLYCTWPSLSEDMIVENQVYSDLDPLQAPQWSVRILMTEDPQCLLGDYLVNFIALCHRKETLDQLIGNLAPEIQESEQGSDISHALQRLTEPAIPSFTSYVHVGQGSKPKVKTKDAPIPSELLDQILQFLFPDAKKPAESEDQQNISPDEETKPDIQEHVLAKELSRQLKSAPVSGLLYKLSVCMCILNHDHGGLYAVAHLWQEFVMEMRYRWENNYLIDGVDKGPPNLGTCILQQKLQMLNCCIERKIKREQLHKGYTAEENQTGGGSLHEDNQNSEPQEGAMATRSSENIKIPGKPRSIDSSSDDEFFECDDSENQSVGKEENQSEEKDMDTENPSSVNESENQSDMDCDTNSVASGAVNSCRTSIDSGSAFKETFTHKAEGRLAPITDVKLINCDEQMYIPITQEPAPMTEDMLEEHAEVLAKLGTSAEGAELRARMQSACLLSDMESFKAANPGSVLEDFVRWYSPRDWIEEPVEDENGEIVSKGHLSQRMLIPGNMWVEVWQTARPVPARRQKRLFDDTKEAEKVLHFLSSLKPADVVVSLLPMLIHAALLKALENDDAKIPVLKQVIEQACLKASLVTRSPQQDAKRYEELVRIISHAEVLIARNKSLKWKFTEDLLDRPDALGELQHFVTCILQNSEIAVRGGPQGPAGGVIHKLFVAAQRASYMVLDEEDNEEIVDETKHNSSVPSFPRPTAREYILRTIVPRPAPYSRPLPHRMFCSIEEDEFRLAGAFASDTVFQ